MRQWTKNTLSLLYLNGLAETVEEALEIIKRTPIESTAVNAQANGADPEQVYDKVCKDLDYIISQHGKDYLILAVL